MIDDQVKCSASRWLPAQCAANIGAVAATEPASIDCVARPIAATVSRCGNPQTKCVANDGQIKRTCDLEVVETGILAGDIAVRLVQRWALSGDQDGTSGRVTTVETDWPSAGT